MSKTQVYEVNGTELGKRTCLEGVVYKMKCSCGEEIERDFGEQYLMYPVTGVVEETHMYCEHCDNSPPIRIKVDMVVTIEEY